MLIKKAVWILITGWMLQLSMVYPVFAETIVTPYDKMNIIKSLYEDPAEGRTVVVQGVLVLPETSDEMTLLPINECPTLMIDGERQRILTITEVPASVIKKLLKLSYIHNPNSDELAFPDPYQNAQVTRKFVTITGSIHYFGNDTVPVIIYGAYEVNDTGL